MVIKQLWWKITGRFKASDIVGTMVCTVCRRRVWEKLLAVHVRLCADHYTGPKAIRESWE